MDQIIYIKEQFLKLNIKLTQKQAEQFQKYAELLVEWNSFMNLTAITEFENIVLKHFVDSVAYTLFENSSDIFSSNGSSSKCFMKIVSRETKASNTINNVSRETSTETMIDVGTGAGFPGIPLKIIYPQWKVTLLDSLNKRVRFLNTVISELGLTDIQAIHGRAEETAQIYDFREKYTLCVSRAVANLATLSEYCLPFISVGGRFISYKSDNVNEELKSAGQAIQILGGQLVDKKSFVLPGTDIQRSLILIKKVKSTPKNYPRKAGTPGKNPLI